MSDTTGRPPAQETRSAQYPRRCADVDAQPLDDDLVLYNPRDGGAHTLNGTGMLIWEACDGAHSAEEIAHDLASRYGIGTQRALAEVRAFLLDLEHAGLLAYPDGDEEGRALRAEEGRVARNALQFLALTQGGSGADG